MGQVVINAKPEIKENVYMSIQQISALKIKAQKLGLDEIIVETGSTTDVTSEMDVKLVVYGKGIIYQQGLQHRSMYAGADWVLEEFERGNNHKRQSHINI